MTTDSCCGQASCDVGTDISSVVDVVRKMMEQERTTYCCKQFLGRIEWSTDGCEIYSSLRVRICTWAFDVVDDLNISREIASVAMTLLDRFLATLGNDQQSLVGKDVQLAAIASMYISIKLHDSRGARLSDMCALGGGHFTAEHVEWMEWKILSSLSWHVHPPTSIGFVECIRQLFPSFLSQNKEVIKELHETSMYLAELSIYDGYLLERPSEVALAAIIVAMDLQSEDVIAASTRFCFEQTMQKYFGLQADSRGVHEAYERLHKTYIYAAASAAPNVQHREGPSSDPVMLSSAPCINTPDLHASPSTVILEVSPIKPPPTK